MHPQLSSPLLQGATSSTPTSSSMLGLSANQQGILATHLQSPVTLQSTTTTPSRPSMPTLTPLSAASVSLTSSTTTSSNTQPLLNMPVLGRMQWISIFFNDTTVYTCSAIIHFSWEWLHVHCQSLFRLCWRVVCGKSGNIWNWNGPGARRLISGQWSKPAAPTTDVNSAAVVAWLTSAIGERKWPAHLDLVMGFVLGVGLLSARLLALLEEPG